MQTWLVVAAEQREFDGIVRRCRGVSGFDWPGVKYAKEVKWKQDRWLLVASGPGSRLVDRALSGNVSGMQLSGVISTGYCGALDPALEVGDIVVSGTPPETSSPIHFTLGQILSTDRVAVTAREKRDLRTKTGAVAVEMESAAVARRAAEWSLPFYCVRTVSDTAGEDMPLDFNDYRDSDGRFAQGRIALAAMARPFTRVPALLRLESNCRRAAESLGAFLADCRF